MFNAARIAKAKSAFFEALIVSPALQLIDGKGTNNRHLYVKIAKKEFGYIRVGNRLKVYLFGKMPKPKSTKGL